MFASETWPAGIGSAPVRLRLCNTGVHRTGEGRVARLSTSGSFAAYSYTICRTTFSIMPSPQGVTLRGFSQQAKKDSAILIVEEHVRAPVSSLCNVVRQTRNDKTPESGHFSFPSQGKFGERVG